MTKKESNKIFQVSMLAMASMLLSAEAASAQEAPADMAGAAEEEVDGGSIIVTARRRDEAIQDVPLSVTAVPPAQLERMVSPDLEQLKGTVPNLIIDPVASGPNGAAIAIRGISFEDIEKSFDPAVGLVIDGVYFGSNTGQLADLFDIESIEVLRGPQGTLFGRNTTGGVINLRRTTPTGEWGAEIKGKIGNYGQRGASAVINAPVIEDLIALKVYNNFTEVGGWVRNETKGVSAPNVQTNNFGVALLITPSDTVSLKLTYDRYDLDSPNNDVVAPTSLTSYDLVCRINPATGLTLSGVPLSQCNRNTGDDLYTTYQDEDTFMEYGQNTYIAELEWEISPDLTLTSVTSRMDTKEHSRTDFEASSITFFSSDRTQAYRQWSQEVRLAGQLGDMIDFVVGGFYFSNGYDSRNLTNFGPFFQAIGRQPQAVLEPDYDSNSLAFFADVDFQLTDDLRVSVGGRYTEDEKTITSVIPGFFVGSGAFEGSKFTPKVTVDYNVNADLMVYASYSEGYRSGGVNGRGASLFSIMSTYEPETVKAYEVGFKSSWFDNSVTFNASAFYSDYLDKQESVMRLTAPGTSANAQETVTANAASAELKGLELELAVRPSNGFELSGAVGLLDAKYDSFITLDAFGNPVDRSSLNLRRTPKITAQMGANYSWEIPDGEVILAAEYIYIDEYDVVINPDPNDPTINDLRGLIDSQNNVNASITYTKYIRDAEVSFRLFMRNILDDRGLGSATIVPRLFADGVARPPRTYGVETVLRF